MYLMTGSNQLPKWMDRDKSAHGYWKGGLNQAIWPILSDEISFNRSPTLIAILLNCVHRHRLPIPHTIERERISLVHHACRRPASSPVHPIPNYDVHRPRAAQHRHHQYRPSSKPVPRHIHPPPNRCRRIRTDECLAGACKNISPTIQIRTKELTLFVFSACLTFCLLLGYNWKNRFILLQKEEIFRELW